MPVDIEKIWEHNGLTCYVRRVHQGESYGFHRCAYVVLPEDHPAYGKNGYHIRRIDVHGGISASGFAELNGEKGFVIGIDFAHSMDRGSNQDDDRKFWELDEVIEQTNKLADQLKKIDRWDIIPSEICEFLANHTEEEILSYRNRAKERGC